MTTNYTAAWVPDDDAHRDWNRAAALAVEWVLTEARNQKATPLLVTSAQSQWSSAPSVARFARTYPATTPRSRNRARSGDGPVLAFVPDYETLYQAAGHARRSSLAVVESVRFPLTGWAMETGALNLLTGETTPDTRTDYQRKELDSIDFYGNNGWTRGFGADQTTRVLRELLSKEPLPAEVIIGSMLAKGHHGDGVARLAKLIERAAPKGGGGAVSSREW